MQTEFKKARIRAWVDGACPFPGATASYGVVVKYVNQLLFCDSAVIGDGPGMTNNVAEYCGLLAFLKWYIPNREKFLAQNMLRFWPVVYSDSQLLVNQMDGTYGVHGGAYVPYYEEATQLITKNNLRISFWWIPREENTEADELSHQILVPKF